MKKVVLSVSISICVLAAAGFAVWNYSVNYMNNSLVAANMPSVTELAKQIEQVPDPSNHTQDQGQSVQEQAAAASSADKQAVEGQQQEANAGNAGQTAADTATSPQAPVQASPPPVQNKPSSGQAQTPQSPVTAPQPSSTGAAASESKDGFTYSAEVSTDKAQKVQDSITLSEKAQLTTILLKKLSSDEISLFLKMAGSGLSVEEKKAAKEKILKKLTEDEYNQLIGIAAKYGLSQGKNYKESLKEFPDQK
jgi:hypothetical protein